MKKIILLSTFLVASVAWANGNGQHNMNEHITPSSAASQAYLAGMQKMHDGMMKGAMAQDPDVAFAEGMTAHHQGAIDMAKTQLKYGKDPEMRKLAEDIIRAQQPEIDQMQTWLKEQKKH
ncbi:CopM family metallochaperone [Citrobacter braakii]